MIRKATESQIQRAIAKGIKIRTILPGQSIEREETPEQRYARTHPEQHRGISGCCDDARNPTVKDIDN